MGFYFTVTITSLERMILQFLILKLVFLFFSKQKYDFEDDISVSYGSK